MNWFPRIHVFVALLVLLGGTGAVTMTTTAANPAVQLSSVTVSPSDPNTGEQVTIDATITNLENSDTTVDVRDLYVRTPGTTNEYARVEDVGTIAPGGSLEIPISTTFESAGEKRLHLNLVVQDEDGEYHSYTYPVHVDVTEPTVKAQLSTRASDESGTTEVALTNFGNTNLSDIEITAAVDGEVVDRKFMFDVPPESNQTTVFDTEDVSTETVRFTANYTAAGDSHTTSLTVDLDDQIEIPGEIRLTSVELLRTGTGVTIQGDAANLGGTDTQSVLVSVQETEDVSPASPSGEYFIGAIDASEFARFELTAQTESGASTVPIEITYIVDNERVTTTQEVTLGAGDTSMAAEANGASGSGERGPADGSAGPGDSGGLPLTVIGIVAAIALVIGFGVYRWRSR